MRSFTQDDAHIFCRPDQVKGEFLRVMDIIQAVFTIFNFENVEAQISLRDPNDKVKYIGSDEVWAESEQAIIDACREIRHLGAPCLEAHVAPACDARAWPDGA